MTAGQQKLVGVYCTGGGWEALNLFAEEIVRGLSDRAIDLDGTPEGTKAVAAAKGARDFLRALRAGVTSLQQQSSDVQQSEEFIEVLTG